MSSNGVDLLAGTFVVLLTYLALRHFGPTLTSTAAWVVIIAGIFLRAFFRELSQDYIVLSVMPAVVLGAQWWAVWALYRRWKERKFQKMRFGSSLNRPAWQEPHDPLRDRNNVGKS